MIAMTLSLPASEVILKRRAKDLSRQNETRSLEPPTQAPSRTAAPAQPAQPGPRPAASAAYPAPAQGVQKLVADLAIIKSRSQVTPEQKLKLAQDLQACAQGVTKPSPESINKLANDIASSLTEKKLSGQDQAQLARNLALVLNSASFSPADTLAVLSSVQTILKSSGVAPQDVQTIVTDLRAIAGEVQRNAPVKAR